MVRLGVVDSGMSPDQKYHIGAEQRFSTEGRATVTTDMLGHGTMICRIIAVHAPDILLYNAQVFDSRGVTTAGVVAAAIDWLVDEKVDIINLSLGLRHDRPLLERACRRALTAGIILIAAAPARGNVPWPAAYPGVIRATGDARCGPREISFLDSDQADFGGCPQIMPQTMPQTMPQIMPQTMPQTMDVPNDHGIRVGGASIGAAHISGQIAACLLAGGNKDTVWQWLTLQAKYINPERRTE